MSDALRARKLSRHNTEMENHMTLRFCLSLCLVGLSQLAMADFTPDDQIVSDPASNFMPPEFDLRTQRVIWQDQVNRLWIAHVEPVTGDIIPPNGKGQMLDSGLSPAGTIGNTPRYTYGAGQSAIVYNKDVDGIRWLAKAEEVAPDTWITSLLESGDDRWKPNGTPDGTTDPPRIVYNKQEPVDVATAWRILDDPASEQAVPGIQGGRFLGSEPYVIYMKQDHTRFVQLYIVSVKTVEEVAITSDPSNKYNGFPFWAPEFHDNIIAAMVNWQEVALYRRIDGTWQEFRRFTIPSEKPLLSSPEGFVVNGKSYITIVTCDELGAGGFVGQPVGPTEIWVASIDPNAPFFRRIDDPSDVLPPQRSEPEPYTLHNRVVVYYTERAWPLDGSPRLLKRAGTGLEEDQTGYDLTSYGGPWSTGFRDNKNCSCTPYVIPDAYEVAGEVNQPNVQFVHPTLGPNDHLYYTIIVPGSGGSTKNLVAVDTDTMTEAYRIGETTTTSKLSATSALVDANGDYYVPANEAVSKFNVSGTRLWQIPTRGVARSAQFTPDGNILFFTWNGWAYVVSPSGSLLLEKNLTPERVFPPDPSCLRPGALASDCAYVGPPAVDAHTSRVYVTKIQTPGNSVVQAFQYQPTPTVNLTSLWTGTSPTFPGITTNPVLSEDYSRLYVQDGSGKLAAIDAATGGVIWSFTLGFVSDQPPVVNAGGYIMPGGSLDQDANYSFVGLVRDDGASAAWAVQNSAYAPKSFSAAGAANRFVVTAREAASGELKLLVVDPTGVVGATSWGTGVVPSTLKGVTLRDDGWVFVQTWGPVGSKAFRPMP